MKSIVLTLFIILGLISSRAVGQRFCIDTVKYIGKKEYGNKFGGSCNITEITLNADSTYLIKRYNITGTRNADTTGIQPTITRGYWKKKGNKISFHSSINMNDSNIQSRYIKRFNRLKYKWRIKKKDRIKRYEGPLQFDKIYGVKPLSRFTKVKKASK
ncbi:MAG: hypothetical protein DRI84_01860 [Bacteroidetes bacterium]|nr:MAG: hypothetical protein DRI84_01860 [Bacteroidota bacterium]